MTDELTLEINGVLLEASKVAEAASRCTTAILEIRQWRTQKSPAEALVDQLELILMGELPEIEQQWQIGGPVTDADTEQD